MQRPRWLILPMKQAVMIMTKLETLVMVAFSMLLLWPFFKVIIAFLNPATLTFLPLVNLVLFCLFIIFILVTLTLKIFSIFVFRFFLFAVAGTLNTILFCSDKFVVYSVTNGDRILSYKCSLSITSISFLILLLNFLWKQLF